MDDRDLCTATPHHAADHVDLDAALILRELAYALETDRARLMAQARSLCEAIYAAHSAGCCWHCQFDDGNMAHHMVDEWAWSNPDCRTPEACKALHPILMALDERRGWSCTRSAGCRANQPIPPAILIDAPSHFSNPIPAPH
jgi:hypothetical protein